MYTRDRQKQNNTITYYSEDQVKRSLLASGVEIQYELDNDVMIFCPFHNNYRSPAGEVSKETGLFWCFSCQESKTLEEVIMQISKKSYFEAIRVIDSNKDDRNLLERLSSTLEKKNELKQFDEELIEKLYKNVFVNPRAIKYFEDRGITKDSVDKYKLGYSTTQDMVIVPVHSPDGYYLGFVGRSIEGKRFKNSTDLPKSKTLFNLWRNKRVDKIFVVESSFDAIMIEQAGGHAVATLGATISKEQRKLLKQYFNQVIALGDNDEAGKNMSNKLMTDLGPGKCIIANLPTMVKDVSDLSKQDLKNFVNGFDNLVVTMLQ
jgi:DNA primase